jgi:hypothetical protein
MGWLLPHGVIEIPAILTKAAQGLRVEAEIDHAIQSRALETKEFRTTPLLCCSFRTRSKVRCDKCVILPLALSRLFSLPVWAFPFLTSRPLLASQSWPSRPL